MAGSLQRSVQDQMADVTECPICTEIFTDPKSLPCLHSFCLKCLERYGKDKKAGDQMACPICRSTFIIPSGGFCNLPNNFFIGKMVEIRKLSSTTISEALCATCPEEAREMAKLFCFECEQNLCERCGTSHKKIKLCQNHQVVEIGKKVNEVALRNSYCVQHPGEIVKMYCEDDKATICILCFAESHQTHKCTSVNKSHEEFSSLLKSDLECVKRRLPECNDSFETLKKLKAGLLAETADAEQKIVNEATRLKALIDSHASVLLQCLTEMRTKKLKEIESAQQDVERFQIMIESYVRYLEELLKKGAPGDICREANQMKTRAEELASLPGICCGCDCCWENISFKSSNLEDVLRINSISNVIGDVSTLSSCNQMLGHDKNIYVKDYIAPEVSKNPVVDNFLAQKSASFSGKSYDICAPVKEELKRESFPLVDVDDSIDREEDKRSRTVEVLIVQSKEVAESIVMLLENAQNGGGPVENYGLNEIAQILTVRFQNKTHAEYFIQQGMISVSRVQYNIRPKLSSFTESDKRKHRIRKYWTMKKL